MTILCWLDYVSKKDSISSIRESGEVNFSFGADQGILGYFLNFARHQSGQSTAVLTNISGY
jgi:hypothetical protein